MGIFEIIVSPDHMIGSGLKQLATQFSVEDACFSRSHDRERIETQKQSIRIFRRLFLPIT